jgi:hypothetical protein
MFQTKIQREEKQISNSAKQLIPFEIMSEDNTMAQLFDITLAQPKTVDLSPSLHHFSMLRSQQAKHCKT